MKKLLAALALTSLLTGCGQALWSASYDGGEYDKISDIRSEAILSSSSCSDPKAAYIKAVELNRAVLKLTVYSQQLPFHEDIVVMERKLHLMTSELVKRYESVPTVSPIYCTDKYQIITRTATTIQSVIGGNHP